MHISNVRKKKIESLADFLNWLSENKNSSPDVEMYFRGHKDKKHKLVPSVYRCIEGRCNESRLYQEMLQKHPKSFENDKGILEKLAKMQHHGLPTRLLDITSNPLVSLFFSCNGDYKKDGKVFLFSPIRSEILFQSDIHNIILTGIESNFCFSDFFNSIIDEIKKEASTFLFSMMLINAYEVWTKQECQDEKSKNLYEYAEKIKDHVNKLNSMKSENKQVEIDNIIYFEENIKEIDEDIKNSFEKLQMSFSMNTTNDELSLNRFIEPMIDVAIRVISKFDEKYDADNYKLFEIYKKLSEYHFIRLPFNNERIQRQNGGFILSPVNQHTGLGVEGIPEISCIISKDKKIKILNELNEISINEEFLFPGLDFSAKNIKEKYKII